MTILDYFPTSTKSLVVFFRDELADRPGRMTFTLRYMLTSLLVSLISVAYGVPLLALSIGVLMYAMQSNSAYTAVVALVFVAATLVEMSILLLILKFTYGTPFLRICSAILITFFSLYMMRVHKAGMLFLPIALTVLFAQTISDSVGNPEIALRAVLWSIVAVIYPLLVIVVCNVVFFPSRPVRQLHDAIERQLLPVTMRLRDLTNPAGSSQGQHAIPSVDFENSLIEMEKLYTFSSIGDAAYRSARAYWHACIAAVSDLSATANGLMLSNPLTDEGRRLLLVLTAEIEALRTSVALGQPYRTNWNITRDEYVTAHSLAVGGMCRTLQALGRFDLKSPQHEAKEKSSMFVPDVRTNPAYLRFALKVILASMICYVFYNGVQWDGIHTSLLTCVLVAYPSAGASYQRMILRFGGALAGGLAALLMGVLVVPHLDGLVGFLLMLAPVFFIGSWIASGSERSSYIGIQLIITFALAMLDSAGPVTDLVEIRDRAVGILIGLTVSTVVYGGIWPESAAGGMRQKLSEFIRELAALIRRPELADDAGQLTYLQQRAACTSALNAFRHARDEFTFEVKRAPDVQQGQLRNADTVLAQGERIFDCWNGLRERALAPDAHLTSDSALQTWRESVANVLDNYADDLTAASPGARAIVPSHIENFVSTWQPLAEQERKLISHVASLPDWTMPVSAVDAASAPAKKGS